MATITVTDLILNFAEACRALVPSLDRTAVSWRDGQQGDNWDRVAEPLFQTLVIEPCVFQAFGEEGSAKLRFHRYGFLPGLDRTAWVTVEGDRSDQMIDLASVEKPFDHVRCGEQNRLVAIANARFAFVYDAGDGLQNRIEGVDLGAE